MTLAVSVRRWIGLRDAVAYWLVQIGDTLLAAVLVREIIDPTLGAPAAMMMLTGRGLGAAFVAELLFTFALCYVVLNVATSRATRTIRSTAWQLGSPWLRARSRSAQSPAAR